VDPQAVAAAVDNSTANDLQDQVQFFTGWNDVVTGPFDMIVANIFLGPLVEMMQTLRQRLKPGGTLIASGIIAPQERALTASLKSVGLCVCSRMLVDGWVALASRSTQDAGASRAQESYAPRICGPGNS
jgi:ribosomal protein L11 methylase PrmA